MKNRMETISFHLKCSEPNVFLVGEKQGQAPFVVNMRPTGDESWSAQVSVREGIYRFRYYSSDGKNIVYFGPAHTGNSTIDGLDALLIVRSPGLQCYTPQRHPDFLFRDRATGQKPSTATNSTTH